MLTTKFLGIDFETQDDQPKTTRITEVGAVLVTLERNPRDWRDHVWRIEKQLELFCYEPDYPPQTESIVELTGITDDMLRSQGVPRREALTQLQPMLEQAEVVFAHKTLFDRTVLEYTAEREGIKLPEREWVCTLSNFPWPKKYTCRKLSHLAYEHVVPHRLEDLHRAVGDVMLMLKLIAQYDIDHVLEYAREPWIYLRAYPIEPWKDGEVQTNIAKKHEFTWQQVRYGEDKQFPKMWVKRVKQRDLHKEMDKLSTLPFRVASIEGLR